jgi:hypothetical protein
MGPKSTPVVSCVVVKLKVFRRYATFEVVGVTVIQRGSFEDYWSVWEMSSE